MLEDRNLEDRIETHHGTGDIVAGAVAEHDADEGVGTGVLAGGEPGGEGEVAGDGLPGELALVVIRANAIAGADERIGAAIGGGRAGSNHSPDILGRPRGAHRIYPGRGGQNGRAGEAGQAGAIRTEDAVVILTQRSNAGVGVIGDRAGDGGDRGEVHGIGGALDEIAGLRDVDLIPIEGHLVGTDVAEGEAGDGRQRRAYNGQRVGSGSDAVGGNDHRKGAGGHAGGQGHVATDHIGARHQVAGAPVVGAGIEGIAGGVGEAGDGIIAIHLGVVTKDAAFGDAVETGASQVKGAVRIGGDIDDVGNTIRQRAAAGLVFIELGVAAGHQD